MVNYIADSKDSFDDAKFVQQYESVSTIMLDAIKGPLIITNCTFSENIGTMGGAITVMSPDFESDTGTSVTNSKPYLYLENNVFQQNMAYFAGNALYVAHTVKRYTSWEHYLNTCGAGVRVSGNLF